MVLALVAFSLLGFSIVMNLFLWVVYKRQYRFATILFDMLRFYPILTIIGLIASVGSDLYLSLAFSESFYWLLPFLLVNFGIQLRLFWQWFSLYRLKNYTEFLKNLRDSLHIRVISLNDWLAKPEKDPNCILVLLRHDVDTDLNRARRMSDEEKKFNIPACYYFRNNAEHYSLDEAAVLIKELVSSRIFEIGFHYETVSNTGGDVKKAIALFPKEVEKFQKIYPVRMISAHGDRIVHDVSKKPIALNHRLVSEKLVDIESLGLISSYQLPHDYYLSDAMGLHHFDSTYHFHDTYMRARFLDSLKLLDQLPKGTLVQILIHPDWWF